MSDTKYTYKDFIISITPYGEEGKYNVGAEVPTDDSSSQVELSTIPNSSIQELLGWVREDVAELPDLEALGTALFNFLFPNTVRDEYRISLNLLKANEGLRIRLRWDFDHYYLSQIPWEYCYDIGRKEFTNLNLQTPILRDLRISGARKHTRLTLPTPINLLIIASNPQNLPPLKIEQEIEKISNNLKELIDKKVVDLQIVHQATYDKFREKVEGADGFKPHILHFIGHGRLNEYGEGQFAFCKTPQPGESDADLKAEFRTATDVGKILTKLTSSLRLVVLNGCKTAATLTGDKEPTQGLLGIAPKLMHIGVMAVIGMQFDMKDVRSIGFIDALYKNVFRGERLDQALSAAREHLYLQDAEDKNGWATPALFMRNVESHLFDPRPLVKELKVPLKTTLRSSLMNLNYKLQKRQFRGFVHNSSRRTGAFLITGSRFDAPHWLLHQLVNELPDHQYKRTFDITIGDHIKPEVNSLWRAIAQALALAYVENEHDQIVDTLCTALEDQNILIVIRDVAYDYQLPDLLVTHFWQPLAKKVQEKSVSEHWMVFIMVDTEKTVEELTLAVKNVRDPNWKPDKPIFLEPIKKQINDDDIDDWIGAEPTLKIALLQQKYHSDDEFVQDLIKHQQVLKVMQSIYSHLRESFDNTPPWAALEKELLGNL